MTPPDTVRASAPESSSLREMLPWLTFLVVFLGLTSMAGEISGPGGSLRGDARAIATVLHIHHAPRR